MTADQDRLAYVITVEGMEDSRYTPTPFDQDEDPEAVQRTRTLARVRELQAEGVEPAAWLIPADMLAAMDAQDRIVSDFPPDSFYRLPTRPEPDPMTLRILTSVPLAHLVHYVVRVRGEERTVVAAFSEEIDALVWQDHLSHEAATQEEPDTYEVEGVHVPTEEELAPFIEQARDALRGASK